MCVRECVHACVCHLISAVLFEAVQEAAGVGQPEGNRLKVVTAFLKESNTPRYPMAGAAARVCPLTLRQSPTCEPTITVLAILITFIHLLPQCIKSLMIENEMLKDPFTSIPDWCYVNSRLDLRVI